MAFNIEHIQSNDYDAIIPLLDCWWDGRNMTDMLPRLFFKHFQNTSFIVRDKNEVIGFLIGFICQTNSELAYVHFIGVNPNYRQLNLGRNLYQSFFSVVIDKGVKKVQCVTSPVNKKSIGFHISLGFIPEPGETISLDGVPYIKDYDGMSEDRVLFTKQL